MSYDVVGGTELLSYSDCAALLRSQTVGRVAVVVGGRAEIFPVNYVMDDDGIIFATNAGSKLAGVLAGEVTFEVDSVEPGGRSGWSVVVHGHAAGLSLADSEVAASPGLRSWTGFKDFVVRLTPDNISGRRVAPESEPEDL